ERSRILSATPMIAPAGASRNVGKTCSRTSGSLRDGPRIPPSRARGLGRRLAGVNTAGVSDDRGEGWICAASGLAECDARSRESALRFQKPRRSEKIGFETDFGPPGAKVNWPL